MQMFKWEGLKKEKQWPLFTLVPGVVLMSLHIRRELSMTKFENIIEKLTQQRKNFEDALTSVGVTS